MSLFPQAIQARRVAQICGQRVLPLVPAGAPAPLPHPHALPRPRTPGLRASIPAPLTPEAGDGR